MARRSTLSASTRLVETPPANRLIGERVTPETANAWIAGWKAQAAQDGLERGAAYWDAAWLWIADQRKSRVRP
jgi:hypothetical protein